MRDAGGCREAVEATGAGLVYRTNDELKTALHRMAEDTSFWQEMRQRARDGYSRLYTRDRHVESYLEIVQSRLAANQSRPKSL